MADLDHHLLDLLGIDADRLARLQAPEHEIEIVGRFHRGRRQARAPGDLLAEARGDVTADQAGHRLADGPVEKLLAHIGVFRIEALRIADGEFQVLGLGDLVEFVDLFKSLGDRLFKKDVLAGRQRRLGHREMGRLGRRRDNDRVDILVGEQVLVVRRRRLGIGQILHLGEPLGTVLGDVQFIDERTVGGGFGADAAAPTGADDSNIDSFHYQSPIALNFGMRFGLCRRQILDFEERAEKTFRMNEGDPLAVGVRADAPLSDQADIAPLQFIERFGNVVNIEADMMNSAGGIFLQKFAIGPSGRIGSINSIRLLPSST